MRSQPTVFVDDRGTGIDRELDFVLPINMARGQFEYRRYREVDVMGRLKSGVSLAEAQAEMDVICSRLAVRFPESNEGLAVRVIPRLFVVPCLLAAASLLSSLVIAVRAACENRYIV